MRSNQLELVGQKIRQLRRERKLTQTDLAGKIGIHQSDLSRMEKGEYRVGLDTLLRILQEFDLSIGDFFEERPRSASIIDRYNGLSDDAKREVDNFIEFKHQQGVAGWDEQAEVAVGRRSLSRSWRQRAGLSRSKSACDGPPITCAT